MKNNRGLLTTFIIATIFLYSVGCVKGEGKKEAVRKAFEGFKGQYVLYASKKTHILEVFARNGERVASYKIAYGLNPDRKPKLCEGDNRTPEGNYRIKEILSMDAEKKSEAYQKLRRMNGIYFYARHGHFKYNNPKADLGDNAYGPRFFLIDYPSQRDWERYRDALKKGAVPVKNGKVRGIGYGLAIHGNADPESIGHLASSGCLRMYNQDIIELEQYVQLGTPVIISGDQ